MLNSSKTPAEKQGKKEAVSCQLSAIRKSRQGKLWDKPPGAPLCAAVGALLTNQAF
jgi:hypothetical protein